MPMKHRIKIGYLLVTLLAILAVSCTGVYRTFRIHTEAEKVILDYADSVQQFQIKK